MNHAKQAQEKCALVVGARGGIGAEMVAALRRHGWRVKALARQPQGASVDGLEWIAGDAMNAQPHSHPRKS